MGTLTIGTVANYLHLRYTNRIVSLLMKKGGADDSTQEKKMKFWRKYILSQLDEDFGLIEGEYQVLLVHPFGLLVKITAQAMERVDRRSLENEIEWIIKITDLAINLVEVEDPSIT